MTMNSAWALALLVPPFSRDESDLGSPCRLALSPDGQTVAAGFKYSMTQLFPTRGAGPARTLGLGDFGAGSSLSFLPDGQTLALASHRGARVEIRSALDGSLVRRLHPVR